MQHQGYAGLPDHLQPSNLPLAVKDKKETWLALDGRAIRTITWPDNETDKGQCLMVTPVQTLTMRVEYMGDRTEAWVVCERHGNEVARHNARMIETIVWLEKTESATAT